MAEISKCPVLHDSRKRESSGARFSNRHWWPEQLNLSILEQNTEAVDPLGKDFNYADEFEKIDYAALKSDVQSTLRDSQDWWPADWGHYGPFYVRMAWHAAGTYRVQDGRGGGGAGMQRFAPLNSWPDNGNLDKARRLLWPVKKKYGQKISWADLMLLAGNVAMEDMGFKTWGFAAGRADVWEPEEDVYWGPETVWLGDERYTGERELDTPLAAVQMGLIYVNPQGPNGNPDPVAAAKDIRETFGRMAMNDVETVALIAGGHTFGKCHGAVPEDRLGADPEGSPMAQQQFGWQNSEGTGNAGYTTTSGLEGAWTTNPLQWDSGYFDLMFKYEDQWELTKSPAGAHQWTVPNPDEDDMYVDAHDSSKKHAPFMLTTDLSLIKDPEYRKISERFHANPDELATEFAKAWFKLLHRDMGPTSRYLGPEIPSETFNWQDPLPEVDFDVINDSDIAGLKTAILDSDLTVAELVETAWASASTYRNSDKRGGANGARIALAPQKDWRANNPAQLSKVLGVLEGIKDDFNNGRSDNKRVSLADLIVLGGTAAVEKAARDAGHELEVAFTPGRVDATQDTVDVDGFKFLEPAADGFRNYDNGDLRRRAEEELVDKANLLKLTAPEMTVLVGGLRSLGISADGDHGVFTDRPGQLTQDFFVNLLDMGTAWSATDDSDRFFEGKDRATGEVKWKGTRADLVFGSNSILRALAEVYASDDGAERFVKDFGSAWSKVMDLDRFDLGWRA